MNLKEKYDEVNYILENTLKQVKDFQSEIEQQQQDNNKLTEDIKKLEDEQKNGYKTFNTGTHVLIEKHVINKLINDIDDVYMSCDDAQDYCSQVQSDLENLDTYSAEEAYDRARSAKRDAQDISSKLQDLLDTENVEPLAEEGAENA